MKIRVGMGYDVHRIVQERPLWLGGIEIKCGFGLSGHSDADALLHGITDALLGAAGLGDIGRHFPDTDPAYKGIDSKILLSEAVALVVKAGWVIANVDATVIAQAPKLAPHMDKIRQSVAQAIGIDLHRVNIKAKTKEGCDAVGHKEAIEVHAIVLLEAI